MRLLQRLREAWKAPEGMSPWLILAWGIALVVPTAGLRHLWIPDEARYAEVAREMIVGSDWLVPRLDFQPHLTKPPVTYWLIASSLSAFGRNAFAARLPSALAFVGTGIVIVFLARLLGHRRQGPVAGIVFFTSAFPFVGGNLVTTDMILAFWETLAVYLVVRWYRSRPGGQPFLIGAYGALGLAFLTKGPVGIIVPALAFAGWCVHQRRWRVVGELLSIPGLVIFTLVGLSWYLILCLGRPELFGYFVGRETVSRAFTTVHHRNNTWLMYPLVLVLGMAPWTPYTLAAFRGFVVRWRKRQMLTSAEALLASWLLLPLIFFCVVCSRLPLYVLGLFVPLSLLAASRLARAPAGAVDRADQSRTADRRVVAIGAWASAVLVALNIGAGLIRHPQDLYPLVAGIQQTREGGAFDLYTTRRRLYAVHFYTGRIPVNLTPAGADSFCGNPGAAYLLTTRSDLVGADSTRVVGCARLVASHFRYRLYRKEANALPGQPREMLGSRG